MSIIKRRYNPTKSNLERKIRGHVMCKAAEVGKIVINKCLDAGFFIETQKLQKLLVLMQVECIKELGNLYLKKIFAFGIVASQ